MVARLGTVHTAAAEERAAQIGRAAARLPEDREPLALLPEVQTALLHEAEMLEELRDARLRRDAHEVVVVLLEAARAPRRDLRMDTRALLPQEADHLAGDGRVLRREINAKHV